MALIKCPECKNEISSTAFSCPHCGAPNKIEQEKAASKKSFQLILTICYVLMFCIFIWGETFGLTLIQRLTYNFILVAVIIVFDTRTKKKLSLIAQHDVEHPSQQATSTPENCQTFICPQCQGNVYFGQAECQCGQIFDWSKL